MREFDKTFFEFPLCLLSYSSSKWIEFIISFCIVERAKKIKYLDKRKFDMKDDKYLPVDFKFNDDWSCMILEAAQEVEIAIRSIETIKVQHRETKGFVFEYEQKYGTDAFCRIGKNLCLESKAGSFDEIEFRLLCAISSIIGKRAKFKRITKEQLSYRMLGYKNMEALVKESEVKKIRLTNKQIDRIIRVLHAKKFFSKFTYANRQTFYSTTLNDDQLKEAVGNSKVFWEGKKLNLSDKEYTL